MIEFFQKLFVSDFMPHGHCYFWSPTIVWLQVISNSLITIAYYSIPLTLLYFVRQRKDLFPGCLSFLAPSSYCAVPLTPSRSGRSGTVPIAWRDW